MINKGYILIIVVLIAILALNECRHRSSINDLTDSYQSVLSFTEQEQNETLDSDSLIVKELILMKQNIVDSKVANDMLRDEFKGFKKFQGKIKAEMLTEIKGIKIDYTPSEVFKTEFDGIPVVDGNYIHKDSIKKHFVRIPKKIEMDCTWISLHGTIGKNFVLDSLSMLNKFDVVLGYKKPDKFFKAFRKSEPVLEFKSYNPYTSTPYINNLIVKDKNKSFITSKPMTMVYSFAAGFGLSKILK